MIHSRTLTLAYLFRTLLLVCLLGGLFSPPTAIAQVACEYPFTYTGDLQAWTVPPGVNSIRIEAAGGQGGSETVCNFCEPGGRGAKVVGEFAVTPGETLQIIVAGKGGDDPFIAGGGGATFIARGSSGFSDFVTANLLLIAGGGGGAFLVGPGESSTVFQATAAGPGGNNGDGNGGGGASAEQNGQDASDGTGGRAAINGAAGGTNVYGARGGFGGGGAADNLTGGGGGATGGDAGDYDNEWGRAGTSYNGGANPVNTGAANSGNGYVIIKPLGVPDTTPPMAICQNVTVQLNPAGTAMVSAGQVDNGSTDNCGVASLSLSMTSFDCSNVGSNNVTLTATDDSDNSDNCSATVTVQDNVAPIALCQDVTVQLDANGNAPITAGAVDNGSNDACGVASLALTTPGSFTCDDKGTTNTVTLTVTDNNGNSSTCTATATVEDNAPPVALCQDITVQLDASGNTTIMPADVDGGSSDNCTFFLLSLDNNAFGCSNAGSNTVQLTVADFSGNSDNCDATVTVEDNVGPTALCQDVTVQLDDNGDGATTAVAVDNGSNDACGIASISLEPTAFTCSDVGSNTMTLTLTDNNGNVNSCTATATVEDNVAPTITECEGQFAIFNGEDEMDVAPAIDFSATDACGLAATTYSPAVITCDQLGTEVEVAITVMDVNGSPSTCTTTVKVDGLPCGFMDFGDDGIGCEDSNEVSYDGPSETFTLESDGCYTTNFNQDNAAYVKAELCGDGEIIAHVASINPLGQGWAGISMRESEAPGSKKVELMVNLSNFVRRAVRTVTNGVAYPAQFFRPQATWLRIVRTGNQFIGYASTNGSSWQAVMAAYVPMNTCIQAGLVVTNYNAGNVIATFDNVEVDEYNNANLQIPNTDNHLPEATQVQDFSFFPNPVTSELQVDLSNFVDQEVDIRIYNQVGQVILQNRIEAAAHLPKKLDMNQLSSGTYFIEVISGEYRQVKKLLKVGQ